MVKTFIHNSQWIFLIALIPKLGKLGRKLAAGA